MIQTPFPSPQSSRARYVFAIISYGLLQVNAAWGYKLTQVDGGSLSLAGNQVLSESTIQLEVKKSHL